MSIRRPTLSPHVVLWLLSIYAGLALNTTAWRMLGAQLRALPAGNLPPFLTLPLMIIAAEYLLFSLLLLPWVGKILVSAVLVAGAAADYAMGQLGIVIDSDMVRNVAETTVREATEFITPRAVLQVILLGVLPSGLLWWTRIGRRTRLAWRAGAALLAIAAVCLPPLIFFKDYSAFFRNHRELRHYVVPYSQIYAVARYRYKRAYNADRSFVTLDPAPQRLPAADGRPRLTVLVVGETARAANFSLYGYPRPTNPRLSARDLITFRHVSSCGTATATSIPCMFDPEPRADFDLDAAPHRQNLLDLINAAGYRLLWLENDDGCKTVCDRIPHVDAGRDVGAPPCFGDYCHDEILLRRLDELLPGIDRDTVIVLHAMGSHGPAYFKRYPAEFRQFTPECTSTEFADCPLEAIVNSYDNTILYTDALLDQVIDRLQADGRRVASMLYVSDHGESLGENGVFLHGLPYALAPREQTEIPWLLWLSPSYPITPPQRACLRREAAVGSYSHDYLFHSLLRLLGIRSTAYRRELDLFAPCLP